ncbi:unnamed protein product [Adineta steineri]|uniref:Peptidase S1 domain-containing protein n=1 Tax=Adineta steineri TaxID=433720 RepID=A0A814IQV3_9BILA|nr:unnamed protein product [Adineta steineri]CAF1027566.1 unnamed protein product [Adineta steineri]CAF3775398.1 unnamed protein product [Adineta steineri]CAF3823247.1 unnamed protein product [Adineta steineri]
MMIITTILCMLIVFANARWTENDCGKRPIEPFLANNNTVVGGIQAMRGDWPWSCSMRYNGRHICGGSLINTNWIISAAHCVTSTLPTAYIWYCGGHELQVNETYTQVVHTKRVIPHSAYDSQLIRNDIALFELISPVILTDYVLPVCYPSINDTYEHEISMATGWGTPIIGGNLSNVHMEVEMPILTDTACKDKYRQFGNMLDITTQICAGRKEEGKDTCQGDSGGPLIVRHTDNDWYLIGLTSWGLGCGEGGVYTRTSAYRDWVLSYTGSLPNSSV